MKRMALQKLLSAMEESLTNDVSYNDASSEIPSSAISVKRHFIKQLERLVEIIPVINSRGIHSFERVYSLLLMMIQQIYQQPFSRIVQLFHSMTEEIGKEDDTEANHLLEAIAKISTPSMAQLKVILQHLLQPPAVDPARSTGINQLFYV